jgi:hypothetical protein
MKVNLHIERLILDGIDVGPAQRPVLREALEAELGRLLAEGGIGEGLAGGGAVPSVRVKGFQMGEGYDAAQLGRQVAQSVYGGIFR